MFLCACLVRFFVDLPQDVSPQKVQRYEMSLISQAFTRGQSFGQTRLKNYGGPVLGQVLLVDKRWDHIDLSQHSSMMLKALFQPTGSLALIKAKYDF